MTPLSPSQVLAVAVLALIVAVTLRLVLVHGVDGTARVLWVDPPTGDADTYPVARPVILHAVKVVPEGSLAVRCCRCIAVTFTALADRLEERAIRRARADAKPAHLIDEMHTAWLADNERRKVRA